MAIVKIYRDEAEDDLLPRVCARCGEPTELVKDKNFRWHPPWIIVVVILGTFFYGLGLLLYILLAVLMTKRMRVSVPLCAQHRNHWLWRILLTIAGFVVIAALGAIGIVIARDDQGPRGDDMIANVFLGGGVATLVWVIVAAIIHNLAIKPKAITERQIILSGVCQEFKDAMQDEREEEQEREDEEYERRRPAPARAPRRRADEERDQPPREDYRPRDN